MAVFMLQTLRRQNQAAGRRMEWEARACTCRPS